MRIPKVVEIGRHELKITRKKVEDNCIGRLNIRTFEILLNSNYPYSVQQEALLHEVIHAISIIYGLQLTEHQVTTLAEATFSYLLPLGEK